ncbi:hypothetical protein GCM10010417_13300 [Streptomyces carpaticus]
MQHQGPVFLGQLPRRAQQCRFAIGGGRVEKGDAPPSFRQLIKHGAKVNELFFPFDKVHAFPLVNSLARVLRDALSRPGFGQAPDNGWKMRVHSSPAPVIAREPAGRTGGTGAAFLEAGIPLRSLVSFGAFGRFVVPVCQEGLHLVWKFP